MAKKANSDMKVVLNPHMAAGSSFGDIIHRDTNSDVGNTVTITKPSGIVEGDLMIAMIVGDVAGGMTHPSGWIQIAAAIGDTFTSEMSYKIAGASEPASYSWNTGGISSGGAGLISGFRVDGVGSFVLDDDAGKITGQGTVITTNSVDVSQLNALLFCGFGNDDDEAVTNPPSGMDLRAYRVMESVVVAGYSEIRGIGAVTKSVSWGGNSEELSAHAAVFKLE